MGNATPRRAASIPFFRRIFRENQRASCRPWTTRTCSPISALSLAERALWRRRDALAERPADDFARLNLRADERRVYTDGGEQGLAVAGEAVAGTDVPLVARKA